MDDRKYKEFKKKYERFKQNNLPTSFWDDERQVLEYVYFGLYVDRMNGECHAQFRIERTWTDSLGDIAGIGFYYPYTSKYFTSSRGEKIQNRIGAYRIVIILIVL